MLLSLKDTIFLYLWFSGILPNFRAIFGPKIENSFLGLEMAWNLAKMPKTKNPETISCHLSTSQIPRETERCLFCFFWLLLVMFRSFCAHSGQALVVIKLNHLELRRWAYFVLRRTHSFQWRSVKKIWDKIFTLPNPFIFRVKLDKNCKWKENYCWLEDFISQDAKVHSPNCPLVFSQWMLFQSERQLTYNVGLISPLGCRHTFHRTAVDPLYWPENTFKKKISIKNDSSILTPKWLYTSFSW